MIDLFWGKIKCPPKTGGFLWKKIFRRGRRFFQAHRLHFLDFNHRRVCLRLCLINSVSRSADSEKGFLATQILAVGLGYICAVVISLMDYNVVCKFWYISPRLGFWRWSTLPSWNPSCGHRRQGLDPHRRQNLSNVRAGKNLLYRHLRQALGRIEGTKQAENLFRGYDAVPPRAGSHWINPFYGRRTAPPWCLALCSWLWPL